MSNTAVNASAILHTSPLGHGPFHTLDPFLFCVYHKDAYPAAHDDTMTAPRRGNGADFNPHAPYRMYHGQTIPGFPQHPHRGFETVTATIDGLIDHSDSLGNAGRYGVGDLQWMTAGKGVQHSEMFPLIHKDQPNSTRFFQIWLNLPAKNKMCQPNFAMFWAKSIPKYQSPDGLAKATIWYGDYLLPDAVEANPNQPPEKSWAADKANDVAIMHVTVEPGGAMIMPPAREKDVKRSFYLVEGFDGVSMNGQKLTERLLIEVDASQQLELTLGKEAKKASEFLMLQGKPIKEPVAQQGPFVMNTQDEIYQAFRDYRKTEFGGWPWERKDMVFARDKGRFALLYGKETVPEEEDSGVNGGSECEEKESN